MQSARCLVLLTGFIAVTAAAAADSDRGLMVFESQGCVQCHEVNGRGGDRGPDLSRRIGRGYTPAGLSSTIWNHAPKMWQAMEASGIELKPLTPEAAADLVAFFSSSRFFEKPADAGRGRRAFIRNRCADCHAIKRSEASDAPPVSSWTSLGDPVGLAESMWNHAAVMRERLAARKIEWPYLADKISPMYCCTFADFLKQRTCHFGSRRVRADRERRCSSQRAAETVTQVPSALTRVCTARH